MPDICMCEGDGCVVKQECYRYRATPSARQSYFVTPPGKDKSCKYFEPINELTDKLPEVRPAGHQES